MTLQDVANALQADVKACRELLDRRTTDVYVSDLLSDVLAHAREGNVWITLQVHLNIVAIAAMKELAGIVVTSGRLPDDETLRKAAEEKVPVLVTPLSCFESAGRLYAIVSARAHPA